LIAPSDPRPFENLPSFGLEKIEIINPAQRSEAAENLPSFGLENIEIIDPAG
jgi:hypothetical protein